MRLAPHHTSHESVQSPKRHPLLLLLVNGDGDPSSSSSSSLFSSPSLEFADFISVAARSGDGEEGDCPGGVREVTEARLNCAQIQGV